MLLCMGNTCACMLVEQTSKSVIQTASVVNIPFRFLSWAITINRLILFLSFADLAANLCYY